MSVSSAFNPSPILPAATRGTLTDLPPHRHPRRFLFYFTALIVSAALAFVAAGPPPHSEPLLLLVVLAFMALGEAGAVALPSGGYVSVGAVFDIASLVVLGPVWTAILSAGSALFTHGLVLRKPPLRVAHNVAAFAITALAAGAAFLAAGGRVGALDLPRDLPALLACGGVYFALNSLTVSLAIGFSAGPSPARIWQRMFLHGLVHHLSFLALGGLLAMVVLQAGPWSLLLFGVPFLVARNSFKLYVEIRSDLKEFVRALAEVIEEVDPYTRQHSLRVSEYASRLARGLGRPEREVEEIEYAALVHDLGKIGPQNQHILQKAGVLTHEEQRTLRSHPAAGAAIVERVRALRGAAEIVRYHHERPDGRGYPYGLLADDVPHGARILNVADAFDAMTSDRPYRQARPVGDALRELELGGGTQFDFEVVDCLLRLHRDGRFPLIPSPSSEELLRLRVRRVSGRG